jgi:hypothetical protein
MDGHYITPHDDQRFLRLARASRSSPNRVSARTAADTVRDGVSVDTGGCQPVIGRCLRITSGSVSPRRRSAARPAGPCWSSAIPTRSSHGRSAPGPARRHPSPTSTGGGSGGSSTHSAMSGKSASRSPRGRRADAAWADVVGDARAGATARRMGNHCRAACPGSWRSGAAYHSFAVSGSSPASLSMRRARSTVPSRAIRS